MENPRISELRRRIEHDPASIAFAQLADECRRAGQFTEAIEVCRKGLVHHPGYLSARVTLGRALLESGRPDEACIELEHVLGIAPDNLAARRALSAIDQLRQEQHPAPQREPIAPTVEPPHGAVEQLEAWLSAILDDRRRRAANAGRTQD